MQHRILPLSALIALLAIFSSDVFAQTPICTLNATSNNVHIEGLAEQLGNIIVTCSGGTIGSTASLNIFITLNTNITNRLDANGNLEGMTITITNGVTTVTADGTGTPSLRFTSATNINVSAVNYTIGAAPETITISGLRADAAGAPSTQFITASILGIGAQFPSGVLLTLGVGNPTILGSTINNGVPCNGSLLPATLDFPTFASTSTSSTLRITEASLTSFTARLPGDDTGLRVLVKISGYPSGARIFVPDAIVGNSGAQPTSAGAFASTTAGGTYTPGSNQLLFSRVNGADANGAGGTPALGKPVTATTFSTMTELTVTSGAATVAYEVLDSSPSLRESAQIPVFVVVPQTNCPSAAAPVLIAALAPVSTVTTATTTDPIPRFAPTTIGSDCQLQGDCTAAYYPALQVDTAPVMLSAASMGSPQNAAIRVGNTGSGILYFTSTVAYPSGSATGWLTVTPASASNNISLSVVADPTTLQPGAYTASITVSAGIYGMGVVPVTFTVGPVGATVSNVGNAASFTYGTVAPGSYAVLYGLNLSGQNVGVTFNGLPATVIYDSATQINLVVPASLSGQQGAAVVATIDGNVSNSLKVALAANAPGLFNPGIINFADGSINSATHPAARGSFIIIFLTGLNGPYAGVTANIGTQTNLVPPFAGPQPTLPALDQVNIVVPTALPSGTSPVPVQVCIQQTCSNSVNLYVQ
jgi:uncharacterized protein (TIGR03437 family)